MPLMNTGQLTAQFTMLYGCWNVATHHEHERGKTGRIPKNGITRNTHTKIRLSRSFVKRSVRMHKYPRLIRATMSTSCRTATRKSLISSAIRPSIGVPSHASKDDVPTTSGTVASS